MEWVKNLHQKTKHMGLGPKNKVKWSYKDGSRSYFTPIRGDTTPDNILWTSTSSSMPSLHDISFYVALKSETLRNLCFVSEGHPSVFFGTFTTHHGPSNLEV